MAKEITPKDTGLTSFEQLFPPTVDESRLLLGCRRSDYCASKIAHAVEDCNAQVLNLNVTALTMADNELVVDLRVNHRNVDAISRSLTRYGYEVLQAMTGSIEDEERMRERAKEVLRILEV